MEHEPIVVTGAGCVSALGHSVEAFWSALQDGRCGLGKLDESDHATGSVPVVLERQTRLCQCLLGCNNRQYAETVQHR